MKVYANIIKGNGEVIRTKFIGTCYLPEGKMSYRKYRELQRAADKAFPNIKKGQWLEITLENGFVSLNRIYDFGIPVKFGIPEKQHFTVNGKLFAPLED